MLIGLKSLDSSQIPLLGSMIILPRGDLAA